MKQTQGELKFLWPQLHTENNWVINSSVLQNEIVTDCIQGQYDGVVSKFNWDMHLSVSSGMAKTHSWCQSAKST